MHGKMGETQYKAIKIIQMKLNTQNMTKVEPIILKIITNINLAFLTWCSSSIFINFLIRFREWSLPLTFLFHR